VKSESERDACNGRFVAKYEVPSVGTEFGWWRVDSDLVSRNPRKVVCVCRCGMRKPVMLHSLCDGSTKSCGCLRKVNTHSIKHGQSSKGTTPEYTAWKSMKTRCSPTRGRSSPQTYRDYYERGIRVCERWAKSFEAFLEDMGPRPGPGYSLDRIDNNGNYEPGNCRWATATEQQNNSRHNHLLTLNGVTRTICAWAKEIGMSRQGLRLRLKTMSVEEALTRPRHDRSHLSGEKRKP
jgi:hypothetical protein